MPSRSNSVRVELTAQSQVAVSKLKHADAMPALRKKMREATSPLQPAVRSAARSLPSQFSRYKAKERGGSLRTAVANSIVRKMKFSKRRVSVIIAQVPKGGKSNLATVLDGEKEWNHPTYGHKPEVTQEPHPFFFRTIGKLEPSVNRRIESVLDDFGRSI